MCEWYWSEFERVGEISPYSSGEPCILILVCTSQEFSILAEGEPKMVENCLLRAFRLFAEGENF